MARPMQQARGSNDWRKVTHCGMLFCLRNWRRPLQVRGTRGCSGRAVAIVVGVAVCCLLQEWAQAAAVELEGEIEEEEGEGAKVQGRCEDLA